MQIRSNLEHCRPGLTRSVKADPEVIGAPLIVNTGAAKLAKVPMFANIRHQNLKRLAFSRRIHFEPGQVLIRQEEPGADATVIFKDEADVAFGEGKHDSVINRSGKIKLSVSLPTLSVAR